MAKKNKEKENEKEKNQNLKDLEPEKDQSEKAEKAESEKIIPEKPEVLSADETNEVIMLSKEEVDALKKARDDAEKKSAEYLEMFKRERADLTNYKNRTEKNEAAAKINYKADVLKKVLEVLDDLELAVKSKPVLDEDDENKGWTDGIELIARKFQKILEGEGLKKIDAVGKEFDPKYHQAISYEDSDSVKSGFVIEVLQNGYMMGDIVIRPAIVRVAK